LSSFSRIRKFKRLFLGRFDPYDETTVTGQVRSPSLGLGSQEDDIYGKMVVWQWLVCIEGRDKICWRRREHLLSNVSRSQSCP
jgi:hypothetical protein